jgi:hypothetical protein
MNSDPNGNWCVSYCKTTDKSTWNVMKIRRSDGVMVSAKTYNDVFKFVKYQEAFDFVRQLITEEPEPRYDATVKRVCLARGDSFYLSEN